MAFLSKLVIPAPTVVYTDGSCSNGVGGYAWITTNNVQGSGKLCPATNQRSELYAIMDALRCHQGDIDIYTDSAYCIGCLTIWAPRWQQNGWKNSKNQPVANREIIEKCLKLAYNRKIRFFHVKAHSGNMYNELVDSLANRARLCN